MKSAPFFYIDYATKWMLSMVWHLWRIATFRPYFKGIGDTGVTTCSFAFVFIFFSLLRWSVFGTMGLGPAVLGVLIWAAILVAIFERTHRSSSLVLACFGASAITDAIAIVGNAIFEADIGDRRFMLFEFTLYLFAALQFFNEPKEVQATGYRRAKKIPATGFRGK